MHRAKLGFFTMLLAAVTTLAGPEEAFAESQFKRITLAEYGEYLLYAPLYIAFEKGFFREEGLDVRIVPAGGDEKVFAALLSGDAQFGVSDPTFTAISGERGKPGKVVAAILKNIPAWGVTTNEKISNLKNPSELAAYRVATYPAPSTSYTLQKRMFELGRVSPNIVQVAYGGLLAALNAKQVDIALESEPNVSLAESKGARRIYALHQYFPDFAFTGLMVLPEYSAAHPETVRAAVRATLRGAAFLSFSQDESVRILNHRFPEYGPEIIRRALLRSGEIGVFSTDGRFTKAAWDNAIRLRREAGELKREAPFERYVDFSFLSSPSPPSHPATLSELGSLQEKQPEVAAPKMKW